MVDGLKMPDFFAGRGLYGNDALGKEVLTQTMPAIVIVGRCPGGQIYDSQRLITAQVRPDIGVARISP